MHQTYRNEQTPHQKVTGREMIPNNTLHLPTEPPDPMAVVWTAAVVQNRRPVMHKDSSEWTWSPSSWALIGQISRTWVMSADWRMCLLVIWSGEESLSLKWVKLQSLNLQHKRKDSDTRPSAESDSSDMLCRVCFSTLSVCFVSVAAGLPCCKSHRITLSSAEALARTFLHMRNITSDRDRGGRESLWCRKTHPTTLFQDRSRTASEWPSTGSAAF